VPFPSDRKAELTSQDATPRRADGKPDLTGSWFGGGMNWRYGNRRCAPTQLEGCSPRGIGQWTPSSKRPRASGRIGRYTDVIFFYGQYADGGGGYGEYRIVPTDGRKHEPRQALQTKYETANRYGQAPRPKGL
jgi:hypothetical protein